MNVEKGDDPDHKAEGGMDCYLEETGAKVNQRLGFISKKVEVKHKMN